MDDEQADRLELGRYLPTFTLSPLPLCRAVSILLHSTPRRARIEMDNLSKIHLIKTMAKLGKALGKKHPAPNKLTVIIHRLGLGGGFLASECAFWVHRLFCVQTLR